MSFFKHHLHYNPALHSDAYIYYVENEIKGKHFQFSFYFYIFNIFWLLHKKLFGLIPLWIFMMFASLNVYEFFLANRHPMDHQLLLLIIIVPHTIVSFFIYKIQRIYTDNIIWKHKDNINYLMIRLAPYNLMAFSVFTVLAIFLSFSMFINNITKGMQEQNKAKAFIELMNAQTPENRAMIEKTIKAIEEAKNKEKVPD